MTLDEYQEIASETDQFDASDSEGIIVALLGLAGESGSLLTLFKKKMRDGEAYEPIQRRVREELGDVLWYISAIARRSDISLEDVAQANIQKSRTRWIRTEITERRLLDTASPVEEQLPRSFIAELREVGDQSKKRLAIFIDGKKCGSTLTDNAYKGDDYRLHDIIHLAFAAVLGWSPVLRALLGRKRKSSPELDEVEDGGRAIAIEEGLAALVFNYASQHSFLSGVRTLDWPLLRTCHEMTAHLEVSSRSLNDWEQAILKAFEVWRQVRVTGSGFIVADITAGEFTYRETLNNV
jgi:NTP pyrophosphatase (non-canonical NTP hydrolase)